ncbi:ankyrin repeat domain-containing protein [Streptomyces gardneri]|uniref:HEAT repeat domain-containing protein n=1 Tax=Streptomyces gardneri TaxID=66892 RepID=UPI0006E1AB29|nr:HEAT repeat domain-containing protein [Streptomyces gardneri]QPK49966.1 ankyrin repeat domain-containing protein [Streptomyces gardneri]WRK41539.1 ankyrin repeat domain-containing protein [Streptomyces venezuelae]
MDRTQLVAAVRRGDSEAVTALLEAGAVPDTVADDGLPVLCLAVAAFDTAVACALVEGGADPDRQLPDGTTPLIRAIEGGSPAMATAVLGREPRLRLAAADREQLLALARHWYERGAEDELQDRTGDHGPAGRTRVMDDDYNHVTQLTLGGVTVRGGHGAIRTNLEWAFRILTPVDELVARAVAQREPDHVDWSSARWVLGERRSKETWSALTAYRHSPDPQHRLFVLDVLHAFLLSPSSRRNSYETETAELLVAWATDGEDDPGVLADVLRVLSETEHPRSTDVGLRYAGHPAPPVRAQVPDLLLSWDTPPPPLGAAARAALMVLAGDEDWGVRTEAGRAMIAAQDGSSDFRDIVIGLLRDPVAGVRACIAEAVADSPDRSTAVADALVSLLDEDDFGTRLDAAYGLLRRDHPHTGAAIDRVGPLHRPGFEHDHRVSACWRWKWEHDR